MPDFTNPNDFLLASLVFFLVVVFRYLLIAGFFYGYFYGWKPERWQSRKINRKPHLPRQYRKEIGWSLLTSFIFGFFGALTALGWQMGYLRIYTDLSSKDFFYFPFSLLTALFIQECYYYWLHRAMHHPRIYRSVHRVHHDSHITSPWTSFSFHPLESVLQALIFPAMLLILPMHPVVIVIFLTVMTLTSAINHLDIEIYPASFERHWLGRWFIGATHHSLHHRQYRYNYGLYFTFWDKWMQTESPLFSQLFREKTAKASKERPALTQK